MHLDINPDDLRPIVAATVKQCLIELEATSTPDVLSVDEAAKFLRVGSSTVRDLRLKGMLRGYRVGKYVRYRKADLIEFMLENEA